MADPEQRLHLVRGCGGACNQGRAACDCELANDIGPDDKRVIAPPPAPVERNHRAAAQRWALAIAIALYLALAALLRMFGARSFEP